MKKTTLLFLFLTLFLNIDSNAQGINSNYSTNKRREAQVIKKDGTIIKGKVRKFQNKPTFDKINPLSYILTIFDPSYPNYFGEYIPTNVKTVSVKPTGTKKFIEIPIEEVTAVTTTEPRKNKTDEQVLYKAFSGQNFYGKKKKKAQNSVLPVAYEGKVINTYATIFPIRKIFFIGPFSFESGVPEAEGIIHFENKEKKLVLSNYYIDLERKYSAKKAKRRSERDNNKNYNTLNELFGDCPETKALIDSFYIKRIDDKAERKRLAKAYNQQLKKNIKTFKKIIKVDRKNATAELYMQTYKFDIHKIITTYEKHCLPIDEFDSRHENYKKEFDLNLRASNDTLK